MKVLIFGGAGMLGHKLVQILSPSLDVYCTIQRGFESYERFGIIERGKIIENLDVTVLDSVKKAIKDLNPDVVLNAVGVVKQLNGAPDVITTLKINSIFPQHLGKLAAENGFRLISISTDCVFSGSRGMYSEEDIPDALDLYGQSKHWGEVTTEGCLTIRTSMIGRELRSEHGLLEWFLKHLGGSVKGYSRAVFSGFPTLVLADILFDIIEKHRDLSGVVHISSEPITKFDLLNKIKRHYQLDIEVEEDTDFAVDRSLNSEKFRKATDFAPPSWDEMIDRMANDPTSYDRWKQASRQGTSI